MQQPSIHCATQVAWKAGEQAAENREQLTSEVTVGRNLGDVPLPKVLFSPSKLSKLAAEIERGDLIKNRFDFYRTQVRSLPCLVM